MVITQDSQDRDSTAVLTGTHPACPCGVVTKGPTLCTSLHEVLIFFISRVAGLQNNMVLTKAYLRYVQSACFGVVCSLKANIVFVRRRNNKTSKQVTLYAVCPTLESVVVWDVKRGEKVSLLYMEQTASKLSF